MDLSLFLAQIVGPTFFVVGLGCLVNMQRMQQLAREMSTMVWMPYVGGFINFVLGLLLVLYHNVWVSSWVVIITVVGWIMLVKGVTLLLIPKQMLALTKPIMSKNAIGVWSVIALVVGVYLSYVAYFM